MRIGFAAPDTRCTLPPPMSTREVRKSTGVRDLGRAARHLNGQAILYADRTTERFDYLIGADGGHSTTRKILGVAFNGYDLPETWSIADVEARDWPYQNSFVVSALHDGRVAVQAGKLTHALAHLHHVPGLYRHFDVRADFWQCGYTVQQLICHPVRVRSQETDALQSLDGMQACQKPR